MSFMHVQTVISRLADSLECSLGPCRRNVWTTSRLTKPAPSLTCQNVCFSH
uniref:Uncharacterized protein n=1 Tax=Arion vulgaris TaxID=1028688 RepID=A0A0B7ANT5_9EUPU